ncbi:hypothetical protein Poli38472_013228 [Pythium oligandrum]|uniref:Uncharacterized protein n=1 Tax=Pythium oligandrum TaxID=41045 RepID=A0A8K1FD95_PYTOL|nr:hypothetical protein Poli38472_013228 [Pythium oligandrum]|eukprot:TMW55337.1 hypothetical protein Poli38472_013228 [Pythium oligandrum]
MSTLRSLVFVEALDIDKPRLLRPILIERVESSLKQNQFFLFSTPTYVGKTSLFQLFNWDCVKLSWVGVSLRARRVPPIYALLNAGIDFKKKDFSRLRAGRAYLFFLDSAEMYYGDKEFWKTLITDAPSWLPLNYRFIISATDGFYTEEPAEFQTLPRFGMRDFLVNAEESRILLTLPKTGLPTPLRYYNRLLSVVV